MSWFWKIWWDNTYFCFLVTQNQEMALFRWKQTRGKNKNSENSRAVYFSCWECGFPTSLPAVAAPVMEAGFALTCFQEFSTPTSQQPLRFLETNALVFSKINLFLKSVCFSEQYFFPSDSLICHYFLFISSYSFCNLSRLSSHVSNDSVLPSILCLIDKLIALIV